MKTPVYVRKVRIKYKDVSDPLYPKYKQKTVTMQIPTDEYGFLLVDGMTNKVIGAVRESEGHQKVVVLNYEVI